LKTKKVWIVKEVVWSLDLNCLFYFIESWKNFEGLSRLYLYFCRFFQWF